MKTKEIIQLFNGLESCLEFDEVNFKWKAMNNYVALQPIKRNYDSQLGGLQLKHASKDKDGKIASAGEGRILIKDLLAYQKDVDELENSELTVTLQFVKKEDCPATITAKQLVDIRFMIEDWQK